MQTVLSSYFLRVKGRASHPTEAEYQQAYELGKKGLTLKNGAYGGTMEAIAKGCREGGGVVLGIGVEGHTIDRMTKPNPYNSQVIVKPNKNERIIEMLKADMVIVLPGQIGTLEEMFISWVEAIVEDRKPVIIVGNKMARFVEHLNANNFIRKQQVKYIKLVHHIDEIEILG